ncbi:MAG: NAD(P)H-dependent glycerol-3-phosphate dehydrogenase, partial [Pseudomonadota bacterium]
DMYLKGVELDEKLKATGDIKTACDGDVVLIMTPAQHVRETLEKIKSELEGGKPFIICSKGLEKKTGFMMSEVAEEVIPGGNVGILTGPTFASEVGRGLPCAVTIAVKSKEVGEQVVEALGSNRMRTYLTDDLIGAQIGGAIKNVIAIACGVIEGRKMGESARCALITRGLTEIGRLAKAMGAKKETLMGMCGVGDLMLTASSMQSRNFSLGFSLGQGQTLEEILGDRIAVTEGVHTAKALKVMASNNAVDMPISMAVYEFLHEDVGIDEAINKVLKRPLRRESI